jgi:hypothetical protein
MGYGRPPTYSVTDSLDAMARAAHRDAPDGDVRALRPKRRVRRR